MHTLREPRVSVVFLVGEVLSPSESERRRRRPFMCVSRVLFLRRFRSATGMISEVSRSPTGMISNVAAIVLERIFAFNRAEPATSE